MSNNAPGLFNTVKNTGKKTVQNVTNAGNRIAKQVGGLSWTNLILLGAMVLLLVLAVIYYFIYSRNLKNLSSITSPVIISSPIDAATTKVSPVRLPSGGFNYTYSFWIYIADWSYRDGKDKVILNRQGSSGSMPIFLIDGTSNDLVTQTAIFEGVGDRCVVKKIPLQKWVHVVYVMNSTRADIYIDGKLERSCQFDSVPLTDTSGRSPPLDILPADQNGEQGFFGQLANLQYFTRALLGAEVSDIYKRGPYVTS